MNACRDRGTEFREENPEMKLLTQHSLKNARQKPGNGGYLPPKSTHFTIAKCNMQAKQFIFTVL